jgi:hypothetical protein
MLSVHCDTLRISKGIQKYRTKIKKNSMKTKEVKGANLPGAWVCNSKDKGRKSIKSGNIYLQNNEEFQIEIFNPLKECVLADIRLNNQSISKTGLVIKPGQRVYLDCFVDDRKKFIFQTYEIEVTDESQEAIQNNGLMEVFFYKEEAVSLKNWSEKLREVVVREYYPIYVDRYPYYRPYPVWYGNYYGTINIGTTGTYNSTNLTNGVLNSSYTSNFDLSNLNVSNCFSSNSMPISNSLETGRIEKGEKSAQQFSEVDMDFEKNYIHHIVYQLLPESRKPIEVETKKSSEKLKEGHQAADLLIKLKDLKDAGVISAEEFDEKKKELLARI